MLGKFIVLSLFFCLLFNNNVVYAQTKTSDPAITRVGNAPAENKPGVSNDNLAQAASNLVSAYGSCPSPLGLGNSIDGPGPYTKKPCLINILKSQYPNTIAAFDKRYGDARGYGVVPGTCVECLGFVALSLTLVTGADGILGGGNPTYFYGLQTLTLGPLSYNFYTPSDTDPLQSGDIGILANSKAGHILIVNNPRISNTKFTAYESNWGLPSCTVGATSDQVHDKVADGFRFYRRQH